MDQAVGAGQRHEIEFANIARRQAHALRHLLASARIITAAALADVIKAARHISEIAMTVIVLQLDQAALATVIAKRFPFGNRHLLQRFQFPEWYFQALRPNVAPFVA